MSRLARKLGSRPPGFIPTGLVALAIALAVAATSASSEIYRYTDANGREQYTTDLSRVPTAQRPAAAADAAARQPVNRADPDATAGEPAQPGAVWGREAPGFRTPAKPKPWQIKEERPGGLPEATWRDRHDRILAQIDALEQLRAELEAAGGDRRPPNRRGKISRSRYANYQEKHEAWLKTGRDLSRARRRLDSFEERARRAGVPPGWLR
jgi:hypothetical protein